MYTRVSSDKQTTENQRLACTNYIRKIIQPGDQLFSFDEGHRTTRLPRHKRPVLCKMLDFMEPGDMLVTWKIDRLGRDQEEIISIYYEITRHRGVTLKCLGTGDNLSNVTVGVFAIVADQERDNIQSNTINGLARKKANKEKTGTCPYGYKTDETQLQLTREFAKSFNKPYKLIPDDEEQKTIAMMVELRDSGHSYDEITLELFNRGRFNRNGQQFHKGTVYRVLQRYKDNPSLLQLTG